MKNIKRIGLYAALIGAVLLFSAAVSHAAVSRVLCVPWQGDVNAQHTAISGQAVDMHAVIYGDAAGGSVPYTWDFTDGNSTSGTISVPANGIVNLKVTHTYTGALGTPYTTELTVDGVTDTYKVLLSPDGNDSKTNIAIDKALWYLHTQMIRTTAGAPAVPAGYWNDDNNYWVGRTGASAWAFEVQGHLLNVEAAPLAPVEDPYVEDVQRGINYILSRTYYQAMNDQTNGHPEDYDDDGDGDEGNGWGLFAYYHSGHTNYEQGLAIGAIAGSGTPLAVASTGQDTYVEGRTYQAIVQDMADWYSWSQIDGSAFPTSGGRGGFYYTAANNVAWSGFYGDNSASQWAYIGLEAAQNNFGSTIAPFVKRELAAYLHSQLSQGDRGWVTYRSDNYGPYNNVCLTGGALVGMALVGETVYDIQNGAGSFDTDLANVKTFLGNKWHGTWDRWEENWYGHRAYYTMYAVMKGLRLHGISSLPGSPGTADWYGDYVGVMLPDQNASSGYWRGSGWMDGYIEYDMGTAFGVLILTPSVFSPPPVACFTASPNPGYLDIPVTFRPDCSYHADAGKSLVLYEWDFDDDGVYDASSVDPDEQVHTWDSATYALGQYPVTLRVTDNSLPDPVTDTYTILVDLTTPPHPPIADTRGPYMVSQCSNDSLVLDGTGSFDIDEGDSETGLPPFDTITKFEWDINGAPWDYTDGTGAYLIVDAATVASTFSVGANSIGLRVTDNTALAYPTSGEPNLTGEDFGTVDVLADCICNLMARGKPWSAGLGKIQIVWTHTGAASYDIYRSTSGPNSGFTLIADDHVTTYATYLDVPVNLNTPYWYRVVSSDGCGSNAASTAVVTRPITREQIKEIMKKRRSRR